MDLPPEISSWEANTVSNVSVLPKLVCASTSINTCVCCIYKRNHGIHAVLYISILLLNICWRSFHIELTQSRNGFKMFHFKVWLSLINFPGGALSPFTPSVLLTYSDNTDKLKGAQKSYTWRSENLP